MLKELTNYIKELPLDIREKVLRLLPIKALELDIKRASPRCLLANIEENGRGEIKGFDVAGHPHRYYVDLRHHPFIIKPVKINGYDIDIIKGFVTMPLGESDTRIRSSISGPFVIALGSNIGHIRGRGETNIEGIFLSGPFEMNLKSGV